MYYLISYCYEQLYLVTEIVHEMYLKQKNLNYIR